MQDPNTYPEVLGLVQYLKDNEQTDKLAWYEHAMLARVLAGHFQVIPKRSCDGPYLMRFWLSEPKPAVHVADGFESGGSDLLHYFFCPDDDQALHSHPWYFSTTVLRGGYVENLPPSDWVVGSEMGPAWDANWKTLLAGDSASHGISDLHCVAHIVHGTVTHVKTGPRVDTWYFHPPGQPKVHYRKFLEERG